MLILIFLYNSFSWIFSSPFSSYLLLPNDLFMNWLTVLTIYQIRRINRMWPTKHVRRRPTELFYELYLSLLLY